MIPEALPFDKNISFIDIKAEEKLFSNENYDKEIFISKNVESKEIKNQYFMCTLTIGINTTFIKNSAFGQRISSGSGGGIFISFCSLVIEQSESTSEAVIFESNNAEVGGGIFSINSRIFLQKTFFKNNIAMKFGGGIYFQGINSCISHIFMQNGGKFEKNSAGDLGGSICFSAANSTSIEHVEFRENVAGHCGGSIYAAGCSTSFLNCSFIKNTALESELGDWRERGGGAICFVQSNKEKINELSTLNCCFLMNKAEKKMSGNSILFDGKAMWISTNDNFDSYIKGVSVSFLKRKAQDEALVEIKMSGMTEINSETKNKRKTHDEKSIKQAKENVFNDDLLFVSFGKSLLSKKSELFGTLCTLFEFICAFFLLIICITCITYSYLGTGKRDSSSDTYISESTSTDSCQEEINEIIKEIS